MRLILASASPARLATLRSAGLSPEVIVSGVDESQVLSTTAAELATTLASLKANAVARPLMANPGSSADGAEPATDNAVVTPGAVVPAVVIGCDSVLEFDGGIYGKPEDAQTAAARWRAMRGRSGVLHTGHCLIDTATELAAIAPAATTVHFAQLSDAEIDAYVATGEPLAVAGAFTLDGLGGAFVDRIEGDPHNVVGISLPLVRTMMAELGHSWVDFWDSPRQEAPATQD